ncbi:hypothetical protein BDF22DRAFT_673226 [Syncephalis plumigaleata]|nr:hypothetical protein BDF22DRAFT_673226 [Syncephalis plumigaleata]
MVSITNRLGGWDWDGIFSYNTKKMVQIRDRRLGILYFLLIIGIGIFIICDLLINERYNVYERPVPGVVRSQFVKTIHNGNTPDYCQEKDGCVFWDVNQIAFPDTNNQELYISTSVKITTYISNNNCSAASRTISVANPISAALPRNATPAALAVDLRGSDNCIYTNGRSSAVNYFIGYVEDHEIAINHTVRDHVTGHSYHSSHIEGSLAAHQPASDDATTLINFNGSADTETNSTSANSSSRRIPLSTLLKAAGVNLTDDIRTRGVVLVVYIDYSNRFNLFSGSKKGVTYTYRVEAAEEMNTDRVEIVPTSNELVTEVTRKGVRIIFRQTGSFGHFNVIALLKYLCIMLLLGAVASLLIEVVMIYILPQRYLYHARKFELYNGIKEARPLGVAALDDDVSFYTAHQSTMLNSALALNGGAISSTHPRRLSLLRVMNPTNQSLDSTLSSRSVSEPRRRTSSLPVSARPTRNETAITTSDPPSYSSYSPQMQTNRHSMDRLSENTEEHQTSSSKRRVSLHPRDNTSHDGALAHSSSNSDDDHSMVSIALDEANSLPLQPTNTHHSNLSVAMPSPTDMPPVYISSTSQTTSTLPCEMLNNDPSFHANQPSIVPSSTLSRNLPPTSDPPSSMSTAAATRAYRYEPESSRNSWTSNAPVTPYASRGRPRMSMPSTPASHVITSFIQDSNRTSINGASPSRVLSADNTIMSYVSANGTQFSIPQVVVEDTENEDIIPSILASFNPQINKSVDTGYMAAIDDNDEEYEDEDEEDPTMNTAENTYREFSNMNEPSSSSNEPLSVYESRDESSATDTGTLRPVHRSYSDSDNYLANALYAMEALGSSDPSSYSLEQV